MAGRLNECRIFLAEFRRNFRTTGAVLPSGRKLSSALAHFVRDGTSSGPRRILEVGPGTGAVTRQLVRHLRPSDRLDMVELNGSFVDCLNERFRTDRAFQPAADRARVLHCPVEELPTDAPYDVIVSGLPLNNFAVAEVENLVDILRRLAAPRATLSFFEYMAIRGFKATVSGRAERTRLRGIAQVVGRLLKDHEIRRDWIWPNVPPAWVHHVRF